MAEETDKDTPKLDIDWLKTLAGALAAVTTAVLLSTLGAVGTLIGAALGSVAATIGTALYTQGLAKSKVAAAKAQQTALLKVGIAQAEVRRASRRSGDDTAVEAHLDIADERLGEAKADLDEAVHETEHETRPVARVWTERLAALPWKRIALVAGATFLVVVLAITAFEKLAGQSVSSYTGGSDEQGSTIGGVTDDNGSKGKDDKKDDQPRDEQPSEDPAPNEPAPTEVPSTPPSETPSESPSASVEPTPTLPTELPTESATP